MPGLSAFAFASPWLLMALFALPALWFLLRVTPPAPKRLRFPAIRLLQGLIPPEETPARTPWWLLLLRLMAAGLLIVGLAGPTLFPAARLDGSGPLVLVVDTGWAAGKDWPARQQSALAMIDRAERGNRRVVLLTTAPVRPGAAITASNPIRPGEAKERVGALIPRPWPRDLTAARAALDDAAIDGSAHAIWLSSGLAAPGARDFATALQRLGRLDLRKPDSGATARIVMPPEADGDGLTVPVRRAEAVTAQTITVMAEALDGALLGSADAKFAADSRMAEASIDLPLELRNRIARIRLQDEAHAGAVALLDERWRRRPVGLADADGQDAAQPLLSERHYLERALKPYAEVRRDSMAALLQRELSVLFVPDRGRIEGDRRQRLGNWVDEGGVLVRFSGPKLAAELTGASVTVGDIESLLPVDLRRGGRALGGAMSWETPANLAPFPSDSPFAGLDVPQDVAVQRQVLAEPSLDLDKLTWARLADGTPLVTAAPRGNGWVVLVHTTANTRWTNLPLSGLFVQMLRRLSALGTGIPAQREAGSALSPHLVLNGQGDLVAPGDGVRALPPNALARGRVTPAHPPGLYGPREARRAHNLGPGIETLAPLDDLPPGVRVMGMTARPERPLGPWLLAAALVLILADLLIALKLRGLLPEAWGVRWRTRTGVQAGLVFALALSVWPGTVQARDEPDAFAKQAALGTHMGYVETGVDRLDTISRQGLEGLSRVLTRRTAVEPGAPMGIDLRRDPLSVFPVVYWPITPRQPDLTAKAARKVNRFLRNGGTILFDLREPGTGQTLSGQASRGAQALQRLTRDIDMPPLRQVGPEHVLTRAFYLLQEFPGRYTGGTLWVEDTREAPGDGVASVIIGSSNWAAAWAVDDSGQPRFAVTPGGARQREMARRVGVNLVMYALTGNYKADQVHVPAILERLGQ